jgi:hypothetical protein
MAAIAPRLGVEDHEYKSADDFLSALGARHELWSGDSWVYRGQADADWPLLATAVRDDRPFARFGLTYPEHRLDPVPPNWSIRADLQNQLLRHFRIGLDRSGLVIPTPSPQIDSTDCRTITTGAEPHREAFPLMALAQHHGLPTLLLDWTIRAWVAAYFAASDAADDERGTRNASHLAVWALQRTSKCDDKRCSLFYEAPGGTNPNLNAQGGLFTFFIAEDDPSLEEYVYRLGEQKATPWKLRRMLLPLSEAPVLLKLLADEGITGASMFPGADGVVRALRERALWQRKIDAKGKGNPAA